MIKKLIRQMLAAQTLSALTVSLCLLIDSIIIGQYLGEEAIAAYGLANPILLIIGAVGSVLAAGVQVVCSKSIGRGSQQETNAGFSSAIGLVILVSVPFMALVLAFASPLARLMGASGGSLFDHTRSYMTGFIIGAPATMGALILVPFLQMAGQNGLLIAAVGTMTVADIVLDLLNVLVFHGGMFGMGLASSLSYYAALVVGGIYFFSKKCPFKFSRKLVTGAKIKELMQRGIPAVFSMASSVVLVFVMNRILLGVGGAAAVAAFSVISTIGNASNCITTGVGGVSLTLSGVFYNEEDRLGLRTLIGELGRWSVILGASVGIFLIVLAPLAVSLFLAGGGAADLATLGLRIYALGLIPCCLNGTLKNAYQGTDRERFTEIISMAEGAVLPVLAALLLSALFGTVGAWFYFLCGETLTFLGICLFSRRRTGEKPWKEDAILMLPEDFSVVSEELVETDIRSLSDVTTASESAGRFCLERGQNRRISNRIALCVEEMAANVVEHGFSSDQKDHHLSVRVMNKNDRWIIRFRDDCGAFDPVNYVPSADNEDTLGIRLVLGLADEIHYTYSMSLNNLMIVLNSDTISKME